MSKENLIKRSYQLTEEQLEWIVAEEKRYKNQFIDISQAAIVRAAIDFYIHHKKMLKKIQGYNKGEDSDGNIVFRIPKGICESILKVPK